MGRRSGGFSRAVVLGAFVATLVLALSVPSIAFAALMPVYRFLQVKTGTHFYTASAAEKASVEANLSAVYHYEGVAYTVDTSNPRNDTPLYRFYNFRKGVHFYTASYAEMVRVRDTLSATYRLEGVAYYVGLSSAGGSTPVYRFFNRRQGVHFYTADEAEKTNVIANLSSTWAFEGVAFYLNGTPGAPPAGDATAPTTTSNALLNYAGQAGISLSAVDNAGGSGVAHTYFILDGVQTEGLTAYTTLLGTHTLEFWSVDVAGNVEPHHTVPFTIAADMPWHVSTEQFCSQSGCHFSSLTVEHYRYPIGSATKLNCATCHSIDAGFVPETIALGSDDCSDCHAGSTAAPGSPVGHNANGGHALSDLTCTVVGCHSGSGVNLASIHANAEVIGLPIVRGCAVCHDGTTPPPSDCTNVACHGAVFDHGLHTAITSSSLAPETCTTAPCHTASPTALAGVHATCAVCHGSSNTNVRDVIEAGFGGHPAVCEDCHITGTITFDSLHKIGAAPHVVDVASCSTGVGACHPTPFGTDVTVIHSGATTTVAGVTYTGCQMCHRPGVTPSTNCFTCHPHASMIGTRHTIAGSCASSTCHGTDVAHMHAIDFRGSGETPPGCFACHATGVTPSTNCQNCHLDVVTPHNDVAAHSAVTTQVATNSSACVACHGNNVMAVLPAGNSVTGVSEHVGCTCHAYGIAFSEGMVGGTAACQNCHKDSHAAHGFDQTASGHNTTTYGTIGAKTKFDGTQGVTLMWESEEAITIAGKAAGNNGTYTLGQIGTVTTTWAFPTINVFWGSTDASAPVTAMKGLMKDSVVTCQDCHTGLNAAGPHGAAQNWGLDPDYPGDYSYAELTKYVTCNSQYSSTMPAEVANYLTPLSVSGIAMRSGLTTAATLKSRTDGTQGATAVICAKCHDLENYSAASNAVEGANTAHDSHHQDQLDGSAQCVNCHIGVPHGWKMPRLLVDTDVDVAPYRDPDQLGTTRATSTGNNTGDTRGANGFNRQGLQALSGVNDHTLGAADGTQPYSTGDGTATSVKNLAHAGLAYWDESQCQACGDHEGENAPAKIINEP